MSNAVSPGAAFDDHVLVHCPKCDHRGVVDTKSGHLRITCGACGFVKEAHAPQLEAVEPRTALAVYSNGDTYFEAPLWLETECCGGKRLWALNEAHLEYLDAFVRSVQRSREFPSVSGNRQLADKLPSWLVASKHREEVLRALDRLRARL